MSRRILLVAHPARPEAHFTALGVARRLQQANIEIAIDRDLAHTDLADLPGVIIAEEHEALRGCELIVVLGGDGTILRGAELARGTGVPIVGVNLGHVGFLAEAEREALDSTVERIVARDYVVEERLAVEVVATKDGTELMRSWALNEVSIEKAARERMLELALGIDGRPLSSWGCDGLIVATPTGSTAYAFSAGGPIVWPHVQAILVVPISAHALFARPMVIGPDSTVMVQIDPQTEGSAVAWCDGQRAVDLPPGTRIEVRRSPEPVRFARLTRAPFTDRLVAKFDLNTRGWR
ncbi:NAD kinase, partial [Kribbia dieselivorans]|uniref:NAD kinase n=1 Tax=Kribbia dieselivorans TaxID=331526 RepID=UPI000837F3DE